MQQTIKFNTEDGQESVTTEVISGKLYSIIIQSSVPVEVIMYSELGYPILHTKSHIGVEYYAPRCVVRAPIIDMRQSDQFDEFYLDERLDVIVRGPKNAEVVIILRHE